MLEIVNRSIDAQTVERLRTAGVDARLSRLYAARGVTSAEELTTKLAALIAPDRLDRVEEAARLLADAIAPGEHLLIVADYDADGATACAVGVKALRSMGAKVDYIVPNRQEHTYGLSPEIVAEAASRSPSSPKAWPAFARGARRPASPRCSRWPGAIRVVSAPTTWVLSWAHA